MKQVAVVEGLQLVLDVVKTLVDTCVGFEMVETLESQSGIPSELQGL